MDGQSAHGLNKHASSSWLPAIVNVVRMVQRMRQKKETIF